MKKDNKENGLEQTVAIRNKMYGSFDNVARISQELKVIMRPALTLADDTSREALEMILHKLARIAANPENGWKIADNPHDIAGYAKLWDEHLRNVDGAIFTNVEYVTNNQEIEQKPQKSQKPYVMLDNNNFRSLIENDNWMIVFEDYQSSNGKMMLELVNSIKEMFGNKINIGFADIKEIGVYKIYEEFKVIEIPTIIFISNGEMSHRLKGSNKNIKNKCVNYINLLVDSNRSK